MDFQAVSRTLTKTSFPLLRSEELEQMIEIDLYHGDICCISTTIESFVMVTFAGLKLHDILFCKCYCPVVAEKPRCLPAVVPALVGGWRW